MLCIVLLAILTEFISKIRFIAQSSLTGKRKRIGITLLHGLQALVGYVLMLATMTFSVELFCCVVFGLGLGYFVFYDDKDTHVTTNPCCNYMQDEADERNEDAAIIMKQQQEEETPTSTEEEETPTVEILGAMENDSRVVEVQVEEEEEEENV